MGLRIMPLKPAHSTLSVVLIIGWLGLRPRAWVIGGVRGFEAVPFLWCGLGDHLPPLGFRDGLGLQCRWQWHM